MDTSKRFQSHIQLKILEKDKLFQFRRYSQKNVEKYSFMVHSVSLKNIILSWQQLEIFFLLQLLLNALFIRSDSFLTFVLVEKPEISHFDHPFFLLDPFFGWFLGGIFFLSLLEKPVSSWRLIGILLLYFLGLEMKYWTYQNDQGYAIHQSRVCLCTHAYTQ